MTNLKVLSQVYVHEYRYCANFNKFAILCTMSMNPRADFKFGDRKAIPLPLSDKSSPDLVAR